MDKNNNKALTGASAAVVAFSLWGAIPIYFKSVSHIPAFEILAHRVVWTVVFLGIIIILKGSLGNVFSVFKNKKLFLTLIVSSFLISCNWLVFIWAVANGQILEASLGYFTTPIVSVAFGLFFLKEKLSSWQWFAVGLSILSVSNLFWSHGSFPWIAISVSITFGLYGLVRKIAKVDAFSGLFVETSVLVLPMLVYLFLIGFNGNGAYGSSDFVLNGLLMTGGLITATPLVLFAMATKRLRLSTVGFFQYITPTGQFLLAVFLYNEPFSDAHLITFVIIWLALAIYSFDNFNFHTQK
ncbi:MAG: protein RarD [Magnetovibrio sp.]|nr:protein RarD [Magnetovibrio sp.]|tara:strand:- start:2758 stop:3648 length:891 start_codon:yes stop_codon:yes gene_type:complete